jgi:hypothetical protein
MRRKFDTFPCFPGDRQTDSIPKLGTLRVTVLVESCFCEERKYSKLSCVKCDDCA